MADPLLLRPVLRTKLHRPSPTSGEVRRERLLGILDGVQTHPLSLISAPAGYGKSTLVSQWLESRPTPYAWLSLDELDGSLTIFLTYLITAVQELFPEALLDTASQLDSSGDLDVDLVASTLVNELDAIGSEFVFVLDDYHVLEPSSDVHKLIRQLVDHPPRHLHLVIVSRRDPSLPLPTLRAQARLVEVRLEELRFTATEAAAMLQAATGETPSGEALANVEIQLEGWAVGLRLLAAAMKRAPDLDRFLRELGEIENVRDYLLGEVIAVQSVEMRRWMVASSILYHFSARLCEAVCRNEDPSSASSLSGQEFLETLLGENLFCIALDSEGEWFRYHHLFRDFLQTELDRQFSQEEILELHSRASVWCEEQGLIEDAVRHALAAQKEEEATRIVERHRIEVLNEDRWYALNGWLSLLPEAAVQRRPRLLLARAWTYFFRLSLEPLIPLLREIKALLDEDPAGEELLGELDFFRGFCLFSAGRGESSVRLLKRSLRRIPSDDQELGGAVEVILALALQMKGDGRQALERLEGMLADPALAGTVLLTRVARALAFLHIISANLTSAGPVIRLTRATAEAGNYRYAKAWSLHLQGLVHFHRYEMRKAESMFQGAVERRTRLHRRAAVDAFCGLALAQQSLGRPGEAQVTVEALTEHCARVDAAFVPIAQSCRYRLALWNGRPEAEIMDHIEPPSQPLVHWLETPAITRCRAMVAVGTARSLKTAERGLEDYLEFNRAHHNVLQQIEILPWLALTQRKLEAGEQALETLREAVRLAAPGVCMRPFVEAGPELDPLLRRLSLEGIEVAFVQQILSARDPGNSMDAVYASGQRPTPPAFAIPAAAVGPDALTNRELDILELLARRLQNKEIASRLSISRHTVNDHLKHIYQKLGVHGRRRAVAVAKDRGILRPR